MPSVGEVLEELPVEAPGADGELGCVCPVADEPKR